MSTATHALGFTHIAMVLAQGGLSQTTMHLNPYWKGLLEVMIILQAAPLATDPCNLYTLLPLSRYMSSALLFGILLYSTCTVVWGLPIFKSLPMLAKAIPLVVVIAAAGIHYAQGNFEGRLQEVTRE